MIEIKELKTSNELAIIRAIAADIWPKTFAPILSPEQIQYMMQMMYAPEVMDKELADGYHFEVLYSDGEAAGYISYSPYDLDGVAKLHKIYLLQKFQHKGLGSKLLLHVISRCRALGFHHLRLNVNKCNHRAHAVYLAHNFREIEAVQIDIGNNFLMDDYIMQLAL